MPGEIEALASQFLHDPVKVSVAPQSTTAERVRQQATFVNQMEKQALLNLTIQNEDIDRALIFTRTKHGADRVVRFLDGAGIQAMAIHCKTSKSEAGQVGKEWCGTSRSWWARTAKTINKQKKGK